MTVKLQGRDFNFDAGYGRISVVDNEVDGPAVLFIHGNSASKEVFHHQFSSDLGASHRLIALDLPGHGGSDDAAEPQDVYRMGPMAAMVRALLENLCAVDAVLVGWSLGGHIAIEMAGQYPEHRGLVLSGTPPFGPGREEYLSAFNPTEAMALAAKPAFTQEEAALYAETVLGPREAKEPSFVAAIKRADGAMRMTANGDWSMNEDAGLYHKDLLAARKSPVAVIEGASEPFVNRDWMKGITWGNLWGDKYHTVEGAGHAPFLENPGAYNALLKAYLEELRR
jgi:pimeloyl-ACP methyl ester carboxylesterase